MAEPFEAVARKRDTYLQIIQKAQRLNDQVLIRLILKKMTRLGFTYAVSTTSSGCTIIPFPNVHYATKPREYEPTSWWTLVKLTLAVPGSVIALFLLSYYKWGPGMF
ncbi:MAG: hypothetical protein JRF56_21375 [Deltaproteobacteria bacterium]|jgi:hypothetical protein|nr:hypothetical protein [Deltaproteobacteria bacterium]